MTKRNRMKYKVLYLKSQLVYYLHQLLFVITMKMGDRFSHLVAEIKELEDEIKNG